MNLLVPLDDQIVVFGMSCVGKTTFSLSLTHHHYHCFDGLFHWHDLEVLGLSYEANLAEVRRVCDSGPEKFVLDGWTLRDSEGQYLPNASVYVIYATYPEIVNQYRIEVQHPEEFRAMFRQWYSLDYRALRARYLRNEGSFRETTYEEFRGTILGSL